MRTRAILVAAILGSVFPGPLLPRATASDNQPTSLSDAKAAIDANLRTPEGMAFDDRMGEEFVEKHLAPLRPCKQSAGDTPSNFWMLLKLDREGGVQELLLYPTTQMGTCAQKAYLNDKFLPPPQPGYWVGVYVKLSR